MTPITAPAFTAQTRLKPLGFDPARLNGPSEKLIRSHWENNYGGSVKALAVVKKQLAEALANKDTPPYVYNDLKREHLMRTGSVVLHELYFDNLGGDGKADATARSALSDAFGAYDTWETEFRRIGLGLGGGSGWVMLGYNAHTGQVENYDAAPSPPNVLKQSGSGTFPWCVKSDTSIENGSVEVKFKPISGNEDAAGGVVWRWKDGDNYYVARANALEDNVSLYHTTNGRRNTIKYVDAPVAKNQWHTLKVDFAGKSIRVALDGKEYISQEGDHIK